MLAYVPFLIGDLTSVGYPGLAIHISHLKQSSEQLFEIFTSNRFGDIIIHS
jgi:hypothetical protein